ncbi:MAG: hypothetical protein HF962_03330 [Sulfurovum sp.]|nr:hypothetical protein [Sulfurovum sp.]
MSFLATNEELLLVHKDMPQVVRIKRYDLMLTPQFYIFKKESLPVSYQYQATKLAPSILDELTGTGNYSYATIKEGDGWALIAYDMGKIESFLEEKGLDSSFINKIYFAQQSKEHFKHPVSMDDKNAIVTVDDTVVMLPKSIVGVEDFGILTNEFRPDKGITPSQSKSSFVDQKQAIIISSLLVLLAIGYFFEGIRYQKSISLADEKIEAVKSRHPQLQGKSDIVLNNLYESKFAIDSMQRKIRDRLKSISKLTSKESKIDSLKIDQKGYEVLISVDKKSLVDLKKIAKSKKLIVQDANNSLMLKGVL